MAAVVNHLHFKDPVDTSIFSRAERELASQMQRIDGFRGFEVVQTSDRDVILVILADTADTLNRVATAVGSPWMAANIVPLLDGPPQRHIGETLASFAVTL